MKKKKYHILFYLALSPFLTVLLFLSYSLTPCAHAQEDDVNQLHFVTDKDSVSVPEGGTATFKVRLSQKPVVPVFASVSRVSGDDDITVESGAVLTFTEKNWKKNQTVTLAAAEDPDLIQGTATIRIRDSLSLIPDRDVQATESEDDSLSFETDRDAVTVPEGDTATFRVRLDGEPPGVVSATVTFSGGDEDITVRSDSSITFDVSNWDMFQTVILSAAEDPDAQNGSATILISDVDGLVTDAEVIAAEADNDSINVISPNGGESWITGTSHEIVWTTGGDTGDSVTLEITSGGTFDGTIIPSTPNDGSFTWSIPVDLVPGNDYRIRITALSDPSLLDESDDAFSIVGADQDTDTDGVPDIEEMGPGGNEPEYDGNVDTIPDSRQSSVASLHTFDGSHYVTLEGSSDMSGVSVMAPPPGAPADTAFPYGFFEFSIGGLTPGSPASVTIFTGGDPFLAYYKFGATPDNFVTHWYEFPFDPETVTGAEIDGFIITLSFVDGLRGDDDIQANGVVVDQGGPALRGSGQETGSDCFIATAAYGSPAAPHVQILREFRDSYLLTNRAGRWFVEQYYRYSPPAASWLARHPLAKGGVRILLTPLVILAWTLKNTPLIFPLVIAIGFLGILGRRGRAGAVN